MSEQQARKKLALKGANGTNVEYFWKVFWKHNETALSISDKEKLDYTETRYSILTSKYYEKSFYIADLALTKRHSDTFPANRKSHSFLFESNKCWCATELE